MDEAEDTFFSTEALRLLEAHQLSSDGQAPDFVSSWDTLVIDRDCGSRSTAAAASEGRKRAPDSPHRAESGYFTFPAASDQGLRHKRGKFEDPKRRAEVAQVRKEGACLRCRWSKIPCSSTRPCMSCISSWVSLNSRPSKFQWMDCVPFSWKDVNIYALDDFNKDYNIILQDCSVLMEEHTELDFNEVVQWDIDALSTDFATWMAVDNDHPPATSRVGILSSVECQRLLHRYLDEDLCIQLRLLVKASSLLHNSKNFLHPHYDQEHLTRIRSSVGAKLLKSLETALKSPALAKAPKEKLMSLFLVQLGAIIAVMYTATTAFEEARYELLRILAHHAVYIAERIGLLECDLTKQRLTASSEILWNKTGSFEWNYGTPSTIEDTNLDESAELSHNPWGLPSASTVMTDTPRALFPGNIHPSRGNTVTDVSCRPLYDLDPVLDGGTESAANLSPLGDWPEELVAERNSSPVPMGMTTCFLCNGPVPLDQMCPTCFGPFPVVADCSDGTLHDNLDILSPTPDFQALGPVTANTEDVSVYRNTDLWQTDPSAKNSLHSANSSSESLKMGRYCTTLREQSNKNVPPDDHDTADQIDPRSKETKKRKLIAGKGKRKAQKLNALVQNSPEQNPKNPQRSEEQRQSIPEVSSSSDSRHIGFRRRGSYLRCSACKSGRRCSELWMP